MTTPDDTTDPIAHNMQDELRNGARVVLRVIGVIMAYWDATDMPAAHPYRAAALMLAGYLRRRYGD